MFQPLTPQQRRRQTAILAAGFVAASTGILTLLLMGAIFMLAGDMRYGHPMALYMNQVHMTPFMMPQGTLDGAAWLMLVATYAGLLVGIPTFFILNWGGPEAN